MARHLPANRFHAMPDGRRIAFRHWPGSGPTIVFLPGYMSDMAGGKATALADWAEAQGRACLLFDYSGCGESPGDFADGTLGRWQDEAAALLASHVEGPVVLVGSSMGGWLALLLGRALGPRLAGAGRHRRRARFHRLGLYQRAEAAPRSRRDVARGQSLRPRTDADSSRLLGRRPGAPRARRRDRDRLPGAAAARPGRRRRAARDLAAAGPRACVHRTCRSRWSREATIASRATATSRCCCARSRR